MPDVLRLEVADYTDLTRWRWVLKDENGAFLADHEVRLDRDDAWFEAFTGLQRYVDRHAAPDKRMAQERRIVTALGDWIGREVFGPDIGCALRKHRPATVQVVLPEGAEAVIYLPLEAARLQSRSLADHDFTLVIQPPTADDALSAAKTDRLRVLGLFSLPEGGTALNLRRERQSLVTLIGQIAASGRAAEVKALQYGVTRGRLRDILEDGEGWDVIHISGHGVPGELVIETADGRPDRISAADLADLLELARDRVKLVTVSACWSAALATAEPRRLLGLPAQDHHPERTIAPPPTTAVSGDIATTLASRLGCAVLAMRFPVGDEFAIELAAKLYELLLDDEGQPLPSAVRMTLKHLADRPVGEWFPALSMAAPAIFGAPATGLTLKAPERTVEVSHATENPRMAGFPPQPERFVGRTGVMTRASAALAPDSGIPCVVLHGMPGGGKTACALELAYTHEDAFNKLIWFKAPDEGTAIDGSLANFAETLEHYLEGFQMRDKVVTEESLAAFLPRLTELMKRNRFLLIIDNAESLLTDEGRWRDEQWGKVVSALTGHSGLGRLIMTSRRVSAETALTIVQESVDALSADETLLLVRDLPNLRTLIWGNLPGIDSAAAHNLALGVLDVAQGHPKLLELADGQASNPEQLNALIQGGGQAWQEEGTLPDGFFTTGEASAAPRGYPHVLAAWTNTITGTLSPGEQDLFWFLCCLEEPDRVWSILNANWGGLWQRLGRNGDLPELDQALTTITIRSLAETRGETSGGSESYGIHPVIAAAGRDRSGHDFQDAVDVKASGFWEAVHQQASGKTDDDEVDIELLVRSGLAAVPYLTRRQQWDKAAVLLRDAFIRVLTPAVAAAVLPAIQHITRHAPRHADTLAAVLRVLDPVAAETQLRAFIRDAAARSDYRAASSATGDLIELYRGHGRLADALALTDQKPGYTRQAGLGPWTQLMDEAQRLIVLTAMGHARQVLDDVRRLRDHMDTLPAGPGTREAVPRWQVREALLSTGCSAALGCDRWQDAIDLNTALIASRRDRRVPAAAIARDRFDSYYPLLRLGRTDDVLTLLQECRQAFHDARDFWSLGSTLSALADVEYERGHGDAAIRLQHNGLRYAYLAGDVTGTARGYHGLGTYLRRYTNQPDAAIASHLTAALIFTRTGASSASDSVHSAAEDLRLFGSAAQPPTDVAGLCHRIGDIPGTNPAALIAKLSPDPQTAERTLEELIAQARTLVREAK